MMKQKTLKRKNNIKTIILITLTLLTQGCLEKEHFYRTTPDLIITKRPGSADQYVINNADGSRAAIIKPRPGNPKEYVIIKDGKRIGIISKSDAIHPVAEN